MSNALQFMRVDARQDTFAPIFGRTKNDQGDFHATYSEGEVELTVAGANGENSKRVPLDQVAYDNEQALYLIRRLPLAEGYAASFPIFSVQGGRRGRMPDQCRRRGERCRSRGDLSMPEDGTVDLPGRSENLAASALVFQRREPLPGSLRRGKRGPWS